ncbi:MAG: hypothetical protein ABI551_21095, partial [Polyangiaceae bacterium]
MDPLIGILAVGGAFIGLVGLMAEDTLSGWLSLSNRPDPRKLERGRTIENAIVRSRRRTTLQMNATVTCSPHILKIHRKSAAPGSSGAMLAWSDIACTRHDDVLTLTIVGSPTR